MRVCLFSESSEFIYLLDLCYTFVYTGTGLNSLFTISFASFTPFKYFSLFFFALLGRRKFIPYNLLSYKSSSF